MQARIAETQARSGLEMTPEGVLRMDPRKMEADLAAARDAQGQPLTAQALRDLLQERIREEVTHRI